MLDEQVNMFEICRKISMLVSFSGFFRKCFPVSQEVVGIKNRPEIEFYTSFIDVFVT